VKSAWRKKASGLLKTPGSARAWFDEHQQRTEEKEREYNPPRQNQAGGRETGEQSVQASSGGFVIVRPSDLYGVAGWRRLGEPNRIHMDVSFHLEFTRDQRSEREERPQDKRPRRSRTIRSTSFYGNREAKFRRNLTVFCPPREPGIDLRPSNSFGCNPADCKTLYKSQSGIHDPGQSGVQKVASNFTGKVGRNDEAPGPPTPAPMTKIRFDNGITVTIRDGWVAVPTPELTAILGTLAAKIHLRR